MTTLTALKDLYVKLGGSSSDVASITTNDAIVEKITEIAENGTAKVYEATRSTSALAGGIKIEFDTTLTNVYTYLTENDIPVIKAVGPNSSDPVYFYTRFGQYGTNIYFGLLAPYGTGGTAPDALAFYYFTITKGSATKVTCNVIYTAPAS